jgi:hypothetical protein
MISQYFTRSDLIRDALPFGRLWYTDPNATDYAVAYAKFYSRSHDAVIRVYDEPGNVIETHLHRAFCSASNGGTVKARFI